MPFTPGGITDITVLSKTPGAFSTITYDFKVSSLPAAQSGSYYYWALQFGFTNSPDGGYVGFQNNGNLVTQQNVGQVANFAVWGATSGTAGPHGEGGDFGNEGTGYRTPSRYAFSVGITYRVRLAEVGNSVSAYILNTQTSVETFIGSITTGNRGKLTGEVVLFSEVYNQVQSAASVASADVTYSNFHFDNTVGISSDIPDNYFYHNPDSLTNRVDFVTVYSNGSIRLITGNNPAATNIVGSSFDDQMWLGPLTKSVHALGGNDTLSLGAYLTSAEKIDGGTGTDTVTLNGNYSGGLTFTGTTMVNVEKLTLAAGHNYTLTTNNATVASGQTLTINGSALGASNVLTFNGAAETNGHFVIIGGNGGDKLTGGTLSDTFTYTSAAQSTGTHYDTITGFKFGTDIFDIPGGAGTITGINSKVTSGTLSTSTFDANLASAISSSHLGAHHAVLFTPTSGTLSGVTFLIVDLNGVAGYQSGHDLVIRMNGATGTLAAGGFH